VTSILVAVLTSSSALAKKRENKWLFGEFSDNLIYSNVNEKLLKKEISRLQEFELCIRELYPELSQLAKIPTVFIISETTEGLYDFLPYWNDRLMNVSGVFMQGEFVNVILMDGESLSTPIPNNTILHEYVHKILSPLGYTPPWVGEGVAETLAQFEKEGDYYYFGRNVGLKLAHLRTDPHSYMRLNNMFSTTLDSTNYHTYAVGNKLSILPHG